jgi:hypothetical protein
MTSDNPALTLVVTTASPGLAWTCLLASGLDPYEAAVITRPGAAVGSLDGDLGRELAVLTGMMKATQIAVVAHRQDPVYGTPLPPAPGRPPGTGSFPGLADDAVQTVRGAVERLSDAWQVPKGTVVSGIVVQGDGTADNVALEIARGGRKPTKDDSAKIRVQGREIGWDDLGADLDRALATDDLPSLDASLMESLPDKPAAPPSTTEILGGAEITTGPISHGGESSLGPTGLGGKLTTGPSTVGDAAGPLASSGPIGSGHSTDAYGPHALDQEVGGPLSRTEEHHTRRSTGAAKLGAGEIPAPREPSTSPPPPAPAPAPVRVEPIEAEVITAAPIETRAEPDPIDEWFARDTRRKTDQSSKPATLQHRLEEAASILDRFVDTHCEGHDLFRQTVRLHQAGASPGAVMRGMQTMVRELAVDLPDVRAAFGTLEMAQAILSKDEMKLVLRRILF